MPFSKLQTLLESYQGEIILDACCGLGESTRHLAKQHPNALIIGVDKSAARLKKQKALSISSEPESNYVYIQADLQDFWRLLVKTQKQQSAWQVSKQYIFYPNPYPKKSQLGKRWHAGPIFPYIVKLCSNIELRSNWLIYMEEFAAALEQYGINADLSQVTQTPVTQFERKYVLSDQPCWRLETR